MASDFQLGVADSYFEPVRLKPSHSVSGDQLGHHSWKRERYVGPYISSEVFQKHQKTAKCINMHQNVVPLKLLLCWSSMGSNMFQWLSNNTIMPTPKSTIFPLPQPPTRLQPSQCPRSKVSHPTGANPVHLRRSKYRPARQHHRPLLRQGWCHGWAPCHWRSPSEIGCWK